MIPKFSVIVPVYNVASYLQGCLDSIVIAVRIAQCRTEVICVDDGSDDGSAKILDEYVSRLSQSDSYLTMRIIHQPNAGVSAARNVALDLSVGEWVAFIDSDDTWVPELLVRLVERIASHPDAELIGFTARKINADGRDGGVFSRECAASVVKCDDIFDDYRGPRGRYLWAIWDKVFRRDIIERHGIRFALGMRLSEDSLFAQTYMAHAGKFVLATDIVGYNYMMRAESAVHQREAKLLPDPFRPFRELYVIWCQSKMKGLGKWLAFMASNAPLYGKERWFVPGLRTEAINLLLEDRTFNDLVIGFLLRHCSARAKLFAIVYFVVPRFFKRRVLNWL